MTYLFLFAFNATKYEVKGKGKAVEHIKIDYRRGDKVVEASNKTIYIFLDEKLREMTQN